MPTILPAPGRATCCSDTVTTWTGTSWSNPRTFSSGPPVIPSGIAGDPAQHEIVAVTAQGTWTWNGSTWKAEHSPISPPAAAGGVLVYDGASGKLLMFGGELTPVFKSSSQPPAFRVTDGLWTWDGTGWAQLTGAAASPAPSAPPTPTPTFLPPITPAPVSPPPTGVPVPTPRTVPCTPTPAPTPPPAPALTPAPTQGPGAGPNSGFGCATVLVPPASG